MLVVGNDANEDNISILDCFDEACTETPSISHVFHIVYYWTSTITWKQENYCTPLWDNSQLLDTKEFLIPPHSFLGLSHWKCF